MPPPPANHTPLVAALIVTWNRRADALNALQNLAAQRWPLHRLHAVLADNASTDGTPEAVIDRFHPDHVLHNPATTDGDHTFTPTCHRPDVLGRSVPTPAPTKQHPPTNTLGLASLTLVRNAHNLGGCGGFNTAFALARDRLHTPESPLTFVWLLDDDATVGPDTLPQLASTALADPTLGIVGARMADPDHPETTLEAGLTLDPDTGRLGPAPSTPDKNAIQPCQAVAACCLLARWDMATALGFWDRRFFITNDDADWCLRAHNAGWGVACDHNATALHFPTTRKPSPARTYLRRRNAFWMWQHALDADTLRHLTAQRTTMLLDQAVALTHAGRLIEADLRRRAITDSIHSRGGPLTTPVPPSLPLADALAQALEEAPNRPLGVICRDRTDLRTLRTAWKALHASPGTNTPPALIVGLPPALADRPLPPGTSAHPLPEPTTSAPGPASPPYSRPPARLAAAITFDRTPIHPTWPAPWTLVLDPDNPDHARPERTGRARRALTLNAIRLTRPLARHWSRTIRPAEFQPPFN